MGNDHRGVNPGFVHFVDELLPTGSQKPGNMLRSTNAWSRYAGRSRCRPKTRTPEVQMTSGIHSRLPQMWT
jgi:hypothetical protein